MIDYLVSYAHKFAFLAGAAWILGFIALFIFFAVGGIFGPINDAISVLQYLFLNMHLYMYLLYDIVNSQV